MNTHPTHSTHLARPRPSSPPQGALTLPIKTAGLSILIMTIDDALASLKAAGSDKTRQTYARHGVQREMFGVSYADLEKLRKKIKVDDALAQKLWQTGNHDARTLATMIADPDKATLKSLTSWANELDHSLLMSGVSRFASKTAVARE